MEAHLLGISFISTHTKDKQSVPEVIWLLHFFAIGEALPELVGETEPASRDILPRLYNSDSRSFASFEYIVVQQMFHIATTIGSQIFQVLGRNRLGILARFPIVVVQGIRLKLSPTAWPLRSYSAQGCRLG